MEHRTQSITVRVSKTEDAMLRALADADAVYTADVIRRLIRAEYARRFAEKK